MGDEGSGYQVTYEGTEETFSYLPRPGKAKVVYPNGDTFEGEFDESRKKQGHGVYVYAPKVSEETEDDEPATSEYNGMFRHGKKTGLGTMKYADGSMYTGKWVENKKHGDGVMKYANGDIFSGQFRHNKKHGEGVYQYAASGAQLKGEWEHGEVVFGKFTHADGTYYEGYFVDNVFTGEGVHVMKASGLVQEGEFVGKIIPVDDDKDRNRIVWVGSDVCEENGFTHPKNGRVLYNKSIEQVEPKIIQQFNHVQEESKVELTIEVLQGITEQVMEDFLLPKTINSIDATQQLLEDLVSVHRNRSHVMDVDEYLDWFKKATYGLTNTKWRYGDLEN